jgi:hypothetical protein
MLGLRLAALCCSGLVQCAGARLEQGRSPRSPARREQALRLPPERLAELSEHAELAGGALRGFADAGDPLFEPEQLSFGARTPATLRCASTPAEPTLASDSHTAACSRTEDTSSAAPATQATSAALLSSMAFHARPSILARPQRNQPSKMTEETSQAQYEREQAAWASRCELSRDTQDRLLRGLQPDAEEKRRMMAEMVEANAQLGSSHGMQHTPSNEAPADVPLGQAVPWSASVALHRLPPGEEEAARRRVAQQVAAENQLLARQRQLAKAEELQHRRAPAIQVRTRPAPKLVCFLPSAPGLMCACPQPPGELVQPRRHAPHVAAAAAARARWRTPTSQRPRPASVVGDARVRCLPGAHGCARRRSATERAAPPVQQPALGHGCQRRRGHAAARGHAGPCTVRAGLRFPCARAQSPPKLCRVCAPSGRRGSSGAGAGLSVAGGAVRAGTALRQAHVACHNGAHGGTWQRRALPLAGCRGRRCAGVSQRAPGWCVPQERRPLRTCHRAGLWWPAERLPFSADSLRARLPAAAATG